MLFVEEKKKQKLTRENLWKTTFKRMEKMSLNWVLFNTEAFFPLEIRDRNLFTAVTFHAITFPPHEWYIWKGWIKGLYDDSSYRSQKSIWQMMVFSRENKIQHCINFLSCASKALQGILRLETRESSFSLVSVFQ